MIYKIFFLVIAGALVIASIRTICTNLTKSTNFPSPLQAITAYPIPTSRISSTSSSKPSSTPKSNSTPQPISQIQITTNDSGLTQVEINQDTLNTQIKSALVGQSLGSTALGEAKITDTNVIINNGFMEISGTAQNGPINLPFETKATLTLENSQPKLSLSDLSLDGIVLPQIVADQLSSSLQSKVNDLINSYHFELKSIDLQPGKIILTGQK